MAMNDKKSINIGLQIQVEKKKRKKVLNPNVKCPKGGDTGFLIIMKSWKAEGNGNDNEDNEDEQLTKYTRTKGECTWETGSSTPESLTIAFPWHLCRKHYPNSWVKVKEIGEKQQTTGRAVVPSQATPKTAKDTKWA